MTDRPSSGSVAEIVARARAAQSAWAALSTEERVRRMAPLKDRVLDRAEAMATLVRDEIGKPEVEALLGEVLPSADLVEYWMANIVEMLDPEVVDIDGLIYPGKSGTLEREACGVVAVIMPWNFPVALPLRTLVPALLAGNAVVFKPSEVSPRSGAQVAELFAGLLPEGVLGLVGGGGDAGEALCRADVDLVVFTGSVATGRKVAHACAERLVPCSLELGGKDAAIVLPDADLDRAANGVVWGAMMNAGQSCASIERVYVVRSVGEVFAKKVSEAVAALRPGVDVGPMATAAQRARVSRQVDAAKAAGGKVLAGDAKSWGASERDHAPTVVRVEDDASVLMQDETFGPVLPIALVADENEAVERANASPYGLTASVWSRDKKKAQLLARRLRVGVVTINNHGFTAALPNAPWTGRRQTGWGITGSLLALQGLTRPRFVLLDSSRRKRELWWYPYTPALREAALAMATLRSGTRGIVARVGAFFRLIGAILARARGG